MSSTQRVPDFPKVITRKKTVALCALSVSCVMVYLAPLAPSFVKDQSAKLSEAAMNVEKLAFFSVAVWP
jgi:hypothetical protein